MMQQNESPVSATMFHRIHTFLFTGILITGGILFFILPKEEVSADEKRRLSPFPVFSWEALKTKAFTDSISSYYSDHFIFRGFFIETAAQLKNVKGFKLNNIVYYAAENPAGADAELADTSTNIFSGNAQAAEVIPPDIPFERNSSIVIAGGRAIQSFSGSVFAAERMASLLKHYKTVFEGKVKIHCLAIPIGCDFYLPAAINKKKEIEFINALYANARDQINCVRAYEELSKHSNEYIQFRTDHHWTGRGAYYAYKAFCSANGITPLNLNQLTRKTIPDFLGTLYLRTRSEELRKNIDTVEYFKVPYQTTATIYSSGFLKGRAGGLYVENARGGNSYGVFLGSDYPLMRVVSTVKTGRKILVFKDSYGNAFAPYLASHFDEVFIVDYRKFSGSVKQMVAHYGITDIIFAHNVYVMNSKYTILRALEMLEGGSATIQQGEKENKQQETDKTENPERKTGEDMRPEDGKDDPGAEADKPENPSETNTEKEKKPGEPQDKPVE